MIERQVGRTGPAIAQIGTGERERGRQGDRQRGQWPGVQGHHTIRPTSVLERDVASRLGWSAVMNTATRCGSSVTIPSRDLLDQPGHLVGAAPRQGDAGAAVTIAVDDRTGVGTRLDLEPYLGTTRPQADPMTEHLGVGELGYEPGRAGHDAFGQCRVGLPVPLAL